MRSVLALVLATAALVPDAVAQNAFTGPTFTPTAAPTAAPKTEHDVVTTHNKSGAQPTAPQNVSTPANAVAQHHNASANASNISNFLWWSQEASDAEQPSENATLPKNVSDKSDARYGRSDSYLVDSTNYPFDKKPPALNDTGGGWPSSDDSYFLSSGMYPYDYNN